MLSKSTIKYICSLQKKKYRIKENAFIAEGYKLVADAVKSQHPIRKIFCTEELLHDPLIKNIDKEECSEDELKKISQLTTPPNIIALCNIGAHKLTDNSQLILALDTIQDPGNMGTLMRTCNWFGIKTILLSEGCADIYSPKVVQATMGAIFHVNAKQCKLSEELYNLSLKGYSICGTFLDGTNIYKTALPKQAVIVMGNEGKGISPEIEKLITNKLLIPHIGHEKHQESLNVSIATGIVISEFCRKLF